MVKVPSLPTYTPLPFIAWLAVIVPPFMLKAPLPTNTPPPLPVVLRLPVIIALLFKTRVPPEDSAIKAALLLFAPRRVKVLTAEFPSSVRPPPLPVRNRLPVPLSRIPP
jgi:hypothetical protein